LLNPALKATLQGVSSDGSPPSGQVARNDLHNSPSTPVTGAPLAQSDERPAQEESAKTKSLSTSSPNHHELEQLKHQLEKHECTLKKHDKEERVRENRQYRLVLYGLKK